MTTLTIKPPDNAAIAGMVSKHTDRPSYLLKRSEQMLMSLYLKNSRAAQSKLTFSQLILLCAIKAAPGAHQAVTARMSGMDTPTATVVIRSLVKFGLVERKNSYQDRRQLLLFSTAAGNAAIKSSLKHLAVAQESFLESIKKPEREKLLKLLVKISSNPNSNAPPLCNQQGELIEIPGYFPPQVKISFLLSRCLQVSVSLVTPTLAPFGLSIGQYVTLFVLTTFTKCKLSELSRALGRKRSSLSLILSSLETRSLVSISQKGRSLEISPTRAGIDLYLEARPMTEKANEQVTSVLDNDESREFIRILREALKHHGKLMTDPIMKPASDNAMRMAAS